MDPEFLKALELVAEFDRQRLVVVKENRLYYNENGTIIGLWESNHPEGDNYIVLDNPETFFSTSTERLRVINNTLKVLSAELLTTTKLVKSLTGQRVVAGHAALALNPNEDLESVEFYDRKTDN